MLCTLALESFFDLSSFAHASLFAGCRFPWEALVEIQAYLEAMQPNSNEGIVDAGAHLVRPETIRIGPGTTIEPGAYIAGPCVLGASCTVRHGAYIRGNVIAGDRCVIGHATEVKNSILLDGAQAAHFAYVGDSILGNKVNLGAGTKCANLRFDNQEVVVRFDGEKICTGLRKLGAIIGDGAQLGCNCVTNPGTFVAPGGRTAPCSSVGGFVAGSRKEGVR